MDAKKSYACDLLHPASLVTMSMIPPPSPVPKSYQVLLFGLTWKDGVLSSRKGEKNMFPRLCSVALPKWVSISSMGV